MKSDGAYLRYIIETIGRIESAISGGKAAFLASSIHQDAVLRNLHTMTETTQRLSTELRANHPEVEWAELSAFRNVLVHDYLGIDIDLIWRVVSMDVPKFKEQVTQMLDEVV